MRGINLEEEKKAGPRPGRLWLPGCRAGLMVEGFHPSVPTA